MCAYVLLEIILKSNFVTFHARVPVTDSSRNHRRSKETSKCGLPAWLRGGKGNDSWKIPSHSQQEREMTWNQEEPGGLGISANC